MSTSSTKGGGVNEGLNRALNRIQQLKSAGVVVSPTIEESILNAELDSAARYGAMASIESDKALQKAYETEAAKDVAQEQMAEGRKAGALGLGASLYGQYMGQKGMQNLLDKYLPTKIGGKEASFYPTEEATSRITPYPSLTSAQTTINPFDETENTSNMTIPHSTPVQNTPGQMYETENIIKTAGVGAPSPTVTFSDPYTEQFFNAGKMGQTVAETALPEAGKQVAENVAETAAETVAENVAETAAETAGEGIAEQAASNIPYIGPIISGASAIAQGLSGNPLAMAKKLGGTALAAFGGPPGAVAGALMQFIPDDWLEGIL